MVMFSHLVHMVTDLFFKVRKGSLVRFGLITTMVMFSNLVHTVTDLFSKV